MSRSWREQVRISLAPHQVALVRLAGGLRGGIADRKVLAVAGETGADVIHPVDSGSMNDGVVGDSPRLDASVDNATNGSASGANGHGASWASSNWLGAIEALREMLAHPNVGRRRFGRIDASVVLSNHFVRYLVLPWSSELVTETEEIEFARMRFVQVFGEAANHWRVNLAPARAGAGRVAAAIDQNLLDTVIQTLAGSPFRLVSVQPALMSQFNAWRRQIGDSAWLVLAERGRVLIAWIDRGRWRSIRARPISDAPVPLAQWLAQERLLLEAPADHSKVFLSAVDDVAVDTDGIRVQTLNLRARSGFAPRTDSNLLLAMAGAS